MTTLGDNEALVRTQLQTIMQPLGNKVRTSELSVHSMPIFF